MISRLNVENFWRCSHTTLINYPYDEQDQMLRPLTSDETAKVEQAWQLPEHSANIAVTIRGAGIYGSDFDLLDKHMFRYTSLNNA